MPGGDRSDVNVKKEEDYRQRNASPGQQPSHEDVRLCRLRSQTYENESILIHFERDRGSLGVLVD